jgi:cholesterol transport system auxiliary component
MRLFSRLAVLAALTAALVGCGGIFGGGGPPPTLYTLTSVRDFPPDLPRPDKQLLVEMPEASASIDTRKIALRRNTFNIDYFADALWTDNIPPLVQTFVVESFERSRTLKAVARETLSLHGDFVLRLELRHFEADYGNNQPLPTVRVEMALTLVRMSDRAIVGTRDVVTTANPAANDVPVIVAAFDQAFHAAVVEAVAWTLESARG